MQITFVHKRNKDIIEKFMKGFEKGVEAKEVVEVEGVVEAKEVEKVVEESSVYSACCSHDG